MFIKRLLDVTMAAVVLGIAGLPLLAIALITWVVGAGPFIFRQTRVGRGGKLFTLYKIRTMTVAEGGAGITTECNPRITPFGRILRTTKIDELPQLLNVMRGQMSLVGPRPELPEYIQSYPPEDRSIVLSVLPGLTDFASIRFRSESRLLALQINPQSYYKEIILPAKIRYYKFYVRRCSVATDVYIIFLTVWLLAADLLANLRRIPPGDCLPGQPLALERRLHSLHPKSKSTVGRRPKSFGQGNARKNNRWPPCEHIRIRGSSSQRDN